ncbi:hypothetical protein J7J63_06870 [Candidatus Bipolaricaulota bacterium]|nr:hypothetical protein [Candidatus Bipolaricaulota bacterium]
MMADLTAQARESRLAFWAALLRGAPVDPHEIDREILPLVIDSSQQERVAFILLRAAAAIGQSGSEATVRTLRIAIVYWFSNTSVSPGDDVEREVDLSALQLRDIIGLGLTWREAALAFGVNPRDYSAYQRLLRKLRDECARQWEALFGEPMEQVMEGMSVGRD